MSADDKKSLSFDYRTFLKTVSTASGVYRMYDESGGLLYVGKANNLKNRLSSYFREQHNPRLRALVAGIAHIEVTVVANEQAALLLENEYIKRERPKYNIVFRDDKSYPYIQLTERPSPQLKSYRGFAKRKDCYGPFVSVAAVRTTVRLMQKIFKLRTCEDTIFNNRSRPCLLHQIGRCSAPCVYPEEKTHYAKDVALARLFLQGKNRAVIQTLTKRMQAASEALDYEQAAQLRDQIRHVQSIQSSGSTVRVDVDLVAYVDADQQVCVHHVSVRAGRVIADRSHFLRKQLTETSADVLSAFMLQILSVKSSIQEIIVSEMSEYEHVAHALTEIVGRKVTIKTRVRGERAKWLEMAKRNASSALKQKLESAESEVVRLKALSTWLGISDVSRIVCFDISHHQGGQTVASAVVLDQAGLNKKSYRRLNITDITAGDDYAALSQATRRYYQHREKHAEENAEEGHEVWLIDGGKNQVKAVYDGLADVIPAANLFLLGISKGPARKSGDEQFWPALSDTPLELDSHAPVFHLLQLVRDEAHRFALKGHRIRKSKQQTKSILEDLPGIGPEKRRELLRHFGGLRMLNLNHKFLASLGKQRAEGGVKRSTET